MGLREAKGPPKPVPLLDLGTGRPERRSWQPGTAQASSTSFPSLCKLQLLWGQSLGDVPPSPPRTLPRRPGLPVRHTAKAGRSGVHLRAWGSGGRPRPQPEACCRMAPGDAVADRQETQAVGTSIIHGAAVQETLTPAR